MKKYRCKICGYVYDDAKEKIKFEDLPDNWTCPLCGAPKNLFEEVKEEKTSENLKVHDEDHALKEVSNEEIAFICLNLAKGCEKQYLEEEKHLFEEIANNYLEKIPNKKGTLNDVENLINKDKELLTNSMEIANKYQDRGAKRVVNWASKTTNIIEALLNRYTKEGFDFIKNTKIWVCDICGFVYIGDTPPKACPVCKVPSFKILEVE